MIIALWCFALLAPDSAPAGAEYVKGLKLLEEKKYEEAARAFEEAIRHEPGETASLKYRDPEGRHRHSYYPYYELALSRLAQAQGEASPYVKRQRLQSAIQSLSQTSHPEGAARLAESRKSLDDLETAIAELEINTPPPELAQIRTKIDRLCEAQNFEEALREFEASRDQFGRFEKLKTDILAAIQSRQRGALQNYDQILSSRLESTSRTDPTFEAEIVLPLLKPARVPPEVKKEPAPRFKWLEEFLALYEKELEHLRAATTLAPDQLLATSAQFDALARKALEIDLVLGFRAARNMGHSIRVSRLKELALAADKPDTDLPGTSEFKKSTGDLLSVSDRTIADVEKSLKDRLAQPSPDEVRKYLDLDLPYQKRQIDTLRGKIREVTVGYERRVSAEATARTAQDTLFGNDVMADPQACRALEKPLSTLESQAYFETLPAPVRARVLFARALCEAMAVFLEAESPARVAERCRGDLTRAFTLDPQVDASWRQSGRLSPRIAKVFDEARR